MHRGKAGKQADARVCANQPHALIGRGGQLQVFLNTLNSLVKLCNQVQPLLTLLGVRSTER
ncbi:MAG: hypothetical protein ACLGJB_27645 [Blastocatellia bacterium]